MSEWSMDRTKMLSGLPEVLATVEWPSFEELVDTPAELANLETLAITTAQRLYGGDLHRGRLAVLAAYDELMKNTIAEGFQVVEGAYEH